MNNNSENRTTSFELIDLTVYNLIKVLNPYHLPILKHLSTSNRPLKFNTLKKVFQEDLPTTGALKRRLRNLITSGLVEKSHYSYMKSNFFLKPKGEAITSVLINHKFQNIPQFSDQIQFLMFRAIPSGEEFSARELAIKRNLCGYSKTKRILDRFEILGYLKVVRSGLRQTFYTTTKMFMQSSTFLNDIYQVFRKSKFVELEYGKKAQINRSFLSFLNNRSSVLIEILREIEGSMGTITEYTLSESLLIPIYKIKSFISESEQMGILRTHSIEGTYDHRLSLTNRGKNLINYIDKVSKGW